MRNVVLRGLLFAVGVVSGLGLMGQSSVFLRNNSWLGWDVSVQQRGSHAAQATDYNLLTPTAPDWLPDTEVFTALRDSALLPVGDSVVHALVLRHAADSLALELKLLRGSAGTALSTRLVGDGFATGWSSDQAFHNATVTVAGRSLELIYRADNDDATQSMDIRLAIHETPIYTIDPADFANPNVLNLMAYNVQFLPLGVVGLPQAADRGDLLPAQFSPYQDVVIFEEAFDPLPRLLNLIPAMEAQGYLHNSGILNDYFPFNGGVIIFSKWPMERTDQYDFQLCGPNAQDCLANKGIMYARINKLGKPYNVFGTHFDAGSDTADIEAKTLQYAEMRDFIAAQGIPAWEPILWGGDLNTDALNSHNLYYTMRDSLDFIVPECSGYFESTMNGDTGDVIDHIFIDPRGLLPEEASVFITTFRSIDPVLWDLSDFSDHRSAIGRFRFPDLGAGPGDQDLCPGDPLSVTSTADITVSRQWYRDTTAIPGATTVGYQLPAAAPADAGDYAVEMRWSRTYAPGPGPVNALLYPNGPETWNAAPRVPAGHITVDSANCPVASLEAVALGLAAFPNPSAGEVRVTRTSAATASWRVVDLRGAAVAGGTWVGKTLAVDLRACAAGVYVLEVAERGRVARMRLCITD